MSAVTLPEVLDAWRMVASRRGFEGTLPLSALERLREVGVDFDDVMLERPGAHVHGYGQSKLAQISMTVALAPRFAEEGITMVSLHPATQMDTTMIKDLGVTPRTTVAAGRDHVMGLITAPRLQAGAFYVDGKPAAPRNPQPADAEARARLLALSAELTGVAAR